MSLSYSFKPESKNNLQAQKWIAITMIVIGLSLMILKTLDIAFFSNAVNLIGSLSLISVGSIALFFLASKDHSSSMRNNDIWYRSISSRGILAWIFGAILTGFYILLYWFPTTLGLAEEGKLNTGLIELFDPLSYALKSKPASEWFVYGTLYTLAIVLFGLKFILKYWSNRYQLMRTISVIFFQFCFAFILPEILLGLNQPYVDLKSIWPLNYYFFFDWHIDELIRSGLFGYFILFWGIALIIVITPILTYFFGKRWYCSWVCGCGGLAETVGDDFRHLSDKSSSAWRLERWIIYSVLAFVILMTAAVIVNRFTGSPKFFFISCYTLAKSYGFIIGALFSGVIGVGFYPILGSRVWCRFGCPMAAYLGLLQVAKSKFRITVNGGQCISCGNCSTYCEMGIDVKSYAQQSKDIVRASCVGCGICSAVCPRGVLKLENLDSKGILNETV
ncbi:MAG TPA: 4Fe-4S binding protein [Saprospiraceae bacterium]|nr:4Fe-4S binding protein [Saprospiraceae bacterium]